MQHRKAIYAPRSKASWDELSGKTVTVKPNHMATLRQLAASLSDSEKGLYSQSPYPNRDQELAGITRDMKQLAMEHQLLLIVSSSLSRNVEHRHARTPFLSDLRESRMIEENADVVLLLNRPEYYGITEDEHFNSMKDFMEVRVAKNRNGRTGSMKFAFRRKIPAVTIFEDFENKEFLDRFNFLEGGADPPF